MIWWFLILAVGVGAVSWAAIAIYLRIRQAMKAKDAAEQEHRARSA